jgi:hypothetical protein
MFEAQVFALDAAFSHRALQLGIFSFNPLFADPYCRLALLAQEDVVVSHCVFGIWRTMGMFFVQLRTGWPR